MMIASRSSSLTRYRPHLLMNGGVSITVCIYKIYGSAVVQVQGLRFSAEVGDQNRFQHQLPAARTRQAVHGPLPHSARTGETAPRALRGRRDRNPLPDPQSLHGGAGRERGLEVVRASAVPAVAGGSLRLDELLEPDARFSAGRPGRLLRQRTPGVLSTKRRSRGYRRSGGLARRQRVGRVAPLFLAAAVDPRPRLPKVALRG